MAKKKEPQIPKPKEDVRIENGEPKFNAVLSQLVNKPKKTDESTK